MPALWQGDEAESKGVQEAAAIVTVGGALTSRGPISHRLKIPLAKVRRFP